MKSVRVAVRLAVVVGLSAGRPAMAADIKFLAGDIPPYTFVNEGGKPDGVATQIVTELAETLGVPFHVDFLSWPRVQQFVQQNDDMSIMSISRTAEREPLYKWAGPIFVDQEVLMTRRDGRPAYATLADAKEVSVCTLRASPGDALLRQAGFLNIESAPDPSTCARLLQGRRVDAWSVARMVGVFQYKLNGYDPALLSVGPAVRPNDAYMAFSRNISDETVARWQAAIEQLRSNGRIAAIIQSFN